MTYKEDQKESTIREESCISEQSFWLYLWLVQKRIADLCLHDHSRPCSRLLGVGKKNGAASDSRESSLGYFQQNNDITKVRLQRVQWRSCKAD